jgi:hypothetical protein
MQTTTELTPNQLTFLDRVTRGLCVEEAAKEIELRWANIMDWKRNIPEFQLAFEEALECRAMLIRERAHGLIFEALDVLQKVLQDPKSSPSVRLRASLALIKISTTPAAAARRKPAPTQQSQPETIYGVRPENETREIVHSIIERRSSGTETESSGGWGRTGSSDRAVA